MGQPAGRRDDIGQTRAAVPAKEFKDLALLGNARRQTRTLFAPRRSAGVDAPVIGNQRRAGHAAILHCAGHLGVPSGWDQHHAAPTTRSPADQSVRAGSRLCQPHFMSTPMLETVEKSNGTCKGTALYEDRPEWHLPKTCGAELPFIHQARNHRGE